MPVLPTALMLATLAMPPMIVRNTIGPISIRMAVMNVVPTGSIALPALGQSQPTKTPSTIATITQKYSCRYQRVFLIGGCVAELFAIVPTSLSDRVRRHQGPVESDPGRRGFQDLPVGSGRAGRGAAGRRDRRPSRRVVQPGQADTSERDRALITASVTSSVFAVPPMSRVRWPAAVVASMAA